MRILKAVLAITILALVYTTGQAQETFTNDRLEYALEFPSAGWRTITEPDAAHQNIEFVYGDRLEGYLQIRKEMVDAGTSVEDLARRDLDQKLRFLPGFVEGKQEKFSGRLSGLTVSYEYVKTG